MTRPFTVSAEHNDGGLVRLVVGGDLDLATGDILEALIANAVAGQPILQLVVDLAAVDFLDAHGVRALLSGRADADDHGVTLRVEQAHGMVWRVLRITGVLDAVDHHVGAGSTEPRSKQDRESRIA